MSSIDGFKFIICFRHPINKPLQKCIFSLYRTYHSPHKHTVMMRILGVLKQSSTVYVLWCSVVSFWSVVLLFPPSLSPLAFSPFVSGSIGFASYWLRQWAGRWRLLKRAAFSKMASASWIRPWFVSQTTDSGITLKQNIKRKCIFSIYKENVHFNIWRDFLLSIIGKRFFCFKQIIQLQIFTNI